LAARDLLDLPEPPTVIFAASNRILMGVLAALDERRLAVPDDMSVVAFDDSEWQSIWRPPITCVDVAVGEMAHLAADLLLRRIEHPSHPRKPVTYLLSTSLIERSSCRTVQTLRPIVRVKGESPADPHRDVVADQSRLVIPEARGAAISMPITGW
jgi:LacI family transcriptional regulator